jgi:hypothetical protein
MSRNKPKLLPVRVPWAVSSVPYLRAQTVEEDQPLSATFIGYFKRHDVVAAGGAARGIERVLDPGEFRSAADDGTNAYRQVRINFHGGRHLRISPAVSEHDVIGDDGYDWSAVPGSLRAGEDAQDNLKRTESYWLEVGESPDPGVYEIEGSTWLDELCPQARGLHHYLLVGDDEAVEVVAQGWSWETGRAA